MANRKFWTEEKNRILESEYATADLSELSERLDATVNAIQQQARSLGLSRGDGWTDEEIALLKKLFPKKENEAVAAEIGKSVSAVRNKAFKLKLKKSSAYWKVGQEKYVLENHGKIPMEDMIKHLKKTKWGIINKYRELIGKRKTGEGRTIVSDIKYQKDV